MLKLYGARPKRVYKFGILLLMISCVAMMATFFIYRQTSADSSGVAWTNSGNPSVVERTEFIYDDEYSPPVSDCRRVFSSNQVQFNKAGRTEPLSGCPVAETDTLRLMSDGYYDTLVAFKGDTRYHEIHYLGCAIAGLYVRETCIYIPETDTLINRVPPPPATGASKLIIYDNFTSRLHATTPTWEPTKVEYDFDRSNPEFVFQDSQSNHWYVKSIRTSKNNKWLLIELSDYGYIRMNLETKEMRKINNKSSSSIVSYIGKADISNDGKHVIVMSQTGPIFDIYDIDSTCGRTIVNNSARVDVQDDVQNPCPSYHFSGTEMNIIDDYNVGDYPKFSSDGGQIKFFANTWISNPKPPYWVTLQAPGYTTKQLDYLALGDSYSSGEGDTEVSDTTSTKYYRPYTDVEENKNIQQPREKCHTSSRSYPYLLSKRMGLGTAADDSGTKWQTIACSGAVVYDVNDTNVYGYEGQYSGNGDPYYGRLHGFNDVESLQVAALNEFIPGRVKQIEFVEKYKPKVITLTMGGNDVGFGKVVEACAQPFSINTCTAATNPGKAKFAKRIVSQFSKLKSLYEQLYDASGFTAKIYVVGYPQFINGNTLALCGLNVGFLDPTEREMMYSATELMNNVIKQAANAAGVKYVDVSGSLEGGRLCDDGQKYMTGITGLGGWNGNQKQESFHPNAKGHTKIAEAIKAKVNGGNLLYDDICPSIEENICPDDSVTEEDIDIPEFFGTLPDDNIQYTNMAPQKAKKQSLLQVIMSQFTLLPGSTAQPALHSDPINLDDITVNADGSLDGSVQIPSSVPAGYHTLVIQGQTYSGEPIEYEQVILVEGSDPDDVDENGIPDSQQPCGPFVQASGVDDDMDGIDDACDPEISDNPQLYRLRQGDPDRTYNGQSEKSHYLYIERNTHASSVTGVTGDYDPDGDGWAVVGASGGVQYTSTTAPDTAPASNFEVIGDGSVNNPYKPIVSLRGGGWGCVQYTPTSLDQVTGNQARTLKRVAVNTDTCRQDSVDYDVDGNGIADDEQALYVARDGDSTQSEDPDRIYLYRNFYASEAQLGISDYTPTGTSANTIAALPLIPDIIGSPHDPIFGRAKEPIQEWNLLSISKANTYIPKYNKLVVLEPNSVDNPTSSPLPVILTKKQNGQCLAYKPANTNVIKFNQQNNLTKMANVPEGASCE